MISETGRKAVAVCRVSSSSTRTRSSRTRSKISLAVSSAMAFLPACINLSVATHCKHYVAHFRPKATISDDRTVSCALTKPSIEITLSIHPGGCERKRRGLRQGPTHTCYEAVCCFVSSLKKRRKFADVAWATSSAPKFLTDAIAFATSAT